LIAGTVAGYFFSRFCADYLTKEIAGPDDMLDDIFIVGTVIWPLATFFFSYTTWLAFKWITRISSARSTLPKS